MKKWLLTICLVFPFGVTASGIPVVDIAGLTQMITDGLTRAQEFKQNMDEARNRLNEMQSTADHYKKMVDGHFNFEDVLNDPYANDFMALDDWKQIYNDSTGLAELRQEFGMYSDDPVVQRQYDNKLRQYNAQTKFYKASVERNKKMQSLLGQFSTATTPAAKEDIANAIRFEQTQVQNDAQMMAAMNSLMAKQRVMEADSAARASTKLLLNEGIPRT
ncbi:conjugal transfer protein TrbJ [Vibrio tasmaniensis ZS-17]|uniref:type IV secretion system protein n=1 Tax=Vibrio tasmaniensis TaxID=212663 RepID=UPI0002FF7659|nr:type IV secretion system protein [Vibrio tasmaniensis]OED65897.1 conjugal transfer protein TrbJ [Vibrio tasmaniensis ZS-17]